ncbi:MAG: hypothetical protein ACOC4J_06370, partial [Bacteroidota bacterium]
MPKFKTILIPMEERVLNMFKGYVMHGKMIPKDEEKKMFYKFREEEYIDDEPKWILFIKIALKIILFIIELPVFLPLFVINVLRKNKKEFLNYSEYLYEHIFCFFLPKSQWQYRYPRKLKYYDAYFEDIEGFFDITFERNYIIIVYSTRWPTREEVSKLKHLKSNGYIYAFFIVKPPLGLLELSKLANVSILNSKFILREADGFLVSKEDTSENLEAKELHHTNVFLLRNQYANVLEYRVMTSFYDFCRFTTPHLLSHETGNLSRDYVIYIGRDEETLLESYIGLNHDKIVEKYKKKGFTFLYYPIAKTRDGYFSDFQLSHLKYRMPRLYSMPDENIRLLINALSLGLSNEDFYHLFVEDLKLPFFVKPALIRLTINSLYKYPNEYTVYTYFRSDSIDPEKWFDYHISKVAKQEKLPKGEFLQLEKKPKDYDADQNFHKELHKFSDDFDNFLEKVNPTQYGALAETMLYMLQKLKDERPDLIKKIQPYLDKTQLLEAPNKLSPVLVDQHYKIFLPEFGNQEVKMHPLPRAVYLLFLRYPEGIRFKELYQYKEELLDIYNKITNRYDNDEIEQAIDDLVDMTKPSINQKCARIREAFRKIMDEL